MSNLFTEFKRRNVFRVAMAYVVISWLVLQVTNTLIPILELPVSVSKTILLILLVGFVPALFFAWAFEITPEGIKKEKNVQRDESITSLTAKKLDIITLIAAVGVFALIGWQNFKPAEQTTSSNSVIPAQAGIQSQNQEMEPRLRGEDGEKSDDISNKSIAVLPFVPLSNDESDEYFGKGIAEELLNSLAQFPDLKVAARTSAFWFEGKNVDLREVGNTLGVAHVLEGSVRRSGERLRITAQLIRASDGFHLWSETYDREQTDIFAIQDEIVAELSHILQFQLGVGAGVDRATRKNVDPRAYNEYLRGLDYWWKRGEVAGNRVLAIKAFQNATQFDKNFADAWSGYAASLILSRGTSPNMTGDEKRAAIDQAMARALELDPNNVRAYAAAVFDDALPIDVVDVYLQKAQQIAPNSPFVNYASGYFYFMTGDHSKSIAAFERTKSLDPLNKTVSSNRSRALGAMGQHRQELNELKSKIVCEVDQCDGNHANDAWAGLLIALQADQQDQLALWLERFNNTLSGWGADQPQDHYRRVELAQHFAASKLDETVDQTFWSSFTEVPSKTDSPTLWAAILAQHGHVEIVLDALEQQEGGLFLNTQDHYILLPGPFEMPETIRRHPRYHALWQRPEMASLAKARRANGHNAGLPLPIDGSDIE
ncbi:MAG: hypothetical protein HKO58_09335 [Gammaproteobacteria bacterium]|nr:hypothetical protein [Gammaproteobacteria bacterium]